MSPYAAPHPCRNPTCATLVNDGMLCQAHRGRITVVYGLPASGKTTWVGEQRQWGDVVWDFDVMMVALTGQVRSKRADDCIPLVQGMRDGLVRALADHTIEQDAWIIVTKEDQARAIAQRVGGDLIEMKVDEDERQRRLDARHGG
jgi:hypothetical protein